MAQKKGKYAGQRYQSVCVVPNTASALAFIICMFSLLLFHCVDSDFQLVWLQGVKAVCAS